VSMNAEMGPGAEYLTRVDKESSEGSRTEHSGVSPVASSDQSRADMSYSPGEPTDVLDSEKPVRADGTADMGRTASGGGGGTADG